jgi:hypothetical protein
LNQKSLNGEETFTKIQNLAIENLKQEIASHLRSLGIEVQTGACTKSCFVEKKAKNQ